MYLMFINPEFHEDVNVTVRRGVKWAVAATPTEFGFPIVPTLQQTKEDGKDNIVGFAKPISAVVKKFSDIKESDITLEHDSDCRTVDGLRKAMLCAYPDFCDDEIVTIFKFRYTA
jgi:hypothetical protein